MPKETINYTDDGSMATSVHWGQHEVQIGVRIDRKSLVEYAGSLGNDDREVQWYTLPLTRAEIQTAIRSLRRARDAVFGSDA